MDVLTKESMKKPDKRKLIAEETFVIRNSGEIPEVTLHEAIYFLTDDPDGPGLELEPQDVSPLKLAVVERYRMIIMRDLDPENRDKNIYRGLARCIANWKRLSRFCTNENLDCREIRAETADGLVKFLKNEVADVRGGRRSSSVNCGSNELGDLAIALGLNGNDLPIGWQELCPAV